MSRPSTCSTTSSAPAAATVVVKKVTFSQPTPRVRQQQYGVVGATSSAANVVVGRGAAGSAAVTVGGATASNRKRRRHLVEAKKMEDSSKPLLPAGSSDMSASTMTISAATTTTDKSTAATEPHSKAIEPETTTPDGTSCPDYFGVKSYLHHFYETVSVKNPDLYEELEGGTELNRPRKPICRSVWWKVAVACGVNLLVIGIVVILVGYLVPRRPIFVAHRNELEVVDRAAVRYNYNLDACKLIGLVVFCVGGITVAVALLFPSFLYNYCDEDLNPVPPDEVTRALNVPDDDDDDDDDDAVGPPGSPTEKKPVPATEQVTRVQPSWDQDSLRPPIR